MTMNMSAFSRLRLSPMARAQVRLPHADALRSRRPARQKVH